MALITKDTKLSEIIIEDPNVITVLNRFGISLGVKDYNVETMCKSKQLDAEFLLTILNTFLNEDYFPENTLKSFNISNIVMYLQKTDNYYYHFQIPNIERHFNFLIAKSSANNNNLELMLKFFIELKEELINQINNDKNIIFDSLLNNQIANNSSLLHFLSKEYTDILEDKLSDLINMFVIHLKGEYDNNLCHAVLLAIISLGKDLKQNNRIRTRVLYPYVFNNK